MKAVSYCLICGKELEYSMPSKVCEVEDSGGKRTIVYAEYDAMEAVKYPNDGVCFQSLGQYGSAIHDMDGEIWAIVICDECLEKREDKIYKVPSNKPLYP